MTHCMSQQCTIVWNERYVLRGMHIFPSCIDLDSVKTLIYTFLTNKRRCRSHQIALFNNRSYILSNTGRLQEQNTCVKLPGVQLGHVNCIYKVVRAKPYSPSDIFHRMVWRTIFISYRYRSTDFCSQIMLQAGGIQLDCQIQILYPSGRVATKTAVLLYPVYNWLLDELK